VNKKEAKKLRSFRPCWFHGQWPDEQKFFASFFQKRSASLAGRQLGKYS
jgi:hypothetical protein